MLSKLGVIGAGAMGSGIAQLAAVSGTDVILADVNQDALDKAKSRLSEQLGKLLEKGKIDASQLNAIFGRISFVSELSAFSDREMVIEAIVEDLDVKTKIFQQLEVICGENTVLASNTSSLSITAMAAKLQRPERFMGIHFFNPAPVMKLVEVVPAIQSDEALIGQTIRQVEAWDKIVVRAKDSPGFIVNKVARPFYSEAIRMMEEGVASKEQIDYAMTSQGFKMGPFALMDFIGHDVNFAVTQSVWKSFWFDDRYKPSFSQQKLVEAGYLGKKSGKGFYNYDAPTEKWEPTEEDDTLLAYIFKRILVMLINEAADTVQTGICSEQDVELAMKFGTNYPKGLLQWAEELGYDEVVYQLDGLYDRYHESRYRVSPYLRDRLSIL
ncbi:MAG: 3-hydroxybutyryl-CoA dehydrogenase [Saprospiraceae bacterium]|nr:3-hydroxybutyryl-CoA dehydrogenase [Saprospiraceae bacterium]MBK9687378.1 3-hydroxybutyryl-CoA dehydrogenase [Saprospiraceae bacterium]MBL0084206.1 3-hydroxybutyryl-CoA dehydrogenase [Saprospiraceae bacterium]